MTAIRQSNLQLLRLLLAVAAAALLAGCSGIGDVFGDDDTAPRTELVEGTVDRIDTRDRRLYIETDRSYRTDVRSGETVVVYYDDRTEVIYEGNRYRPEDLEIGDRIQVRVDEDNNRLWAQQIDVLHDSSPTDRGDDRYARTMEATVRYVDTRNDFIEVEDRYGDLRAIRFDDRTRVDYRGQRYEPRDLERGDEIKLVLRESGDELFATDIEVVRSVSTTAGTDRDYEGDYRRDVSGTVAFVDERARTIELERVNLASSFDRNAGSERVILYYDESTVVEFEGQRYTPANLERGDVINADIREVGNNLLAEEIEVVSDVRERTTNY